MESDLLQNTLDNAQLLLEARNMGQKALRNVIANGKATKLYHRNSIWGHIWSVIHWICRTNETTLAKVIRITTINLSALAKERLHLCTIGKAEGVLGEFWKQYSVTEFKVLTDQHLSIADRFRPTVDQLKNISEAAQWSDTRLGINDQEMINTKALSILQPEASFGELSKISAKINKAQELEAHWQQLVGNSEIPLGILFRELISIYPANDEELIQKRDALQKKLGYCLGGNGWGWAKTKCPPELLFGPLIKIADQIGSQRTHELQEYSTFFDALATDLPLEKRRQMQETAAKIIEVARYLKNPAAEEAITGIPDLIVDNIKQKYYLHNCGLYTTDATSESDCCRVGGGTTTKVIRVGPTFSAIRHHSKYGQNRYPAPRPTIKYIQISTPVQHRRDYYRYIKAQDGTEKLGRFYTFSPTA